MILKARILAATCFLSMAGVAQAAAPDGAATSPPAQQPESSMTQARKGAVDIVSQPARDVGISRHEIPPALAKASEAPYSLQGLKTCRQILAAVGDLSVVLGPDFQPGDKYQESRMAKLAEAGGKTVVNSFLPFRSLVREVSGAAPWDRKLRAAVEAGYARRGFLRGVYATRRCRPAL